MQAGVHISFVSMGLPPINRKFFLCRDPSGPRGKLRGKENLPLIIRLFSDLYRGKCLKYIKSYAFIRGIIGICINRRPNRALNPHRTEQDGRPIKMRQQALCPDGFPNGFPCPKICPGKACIVRTFLRIIWT